MLEQELGVSSELESPEVWKPFVECLEQFDILLQSAQHTLLNGVSLAAALQRLWESETRKRVDLESFALEEVSLTAHVAPHSGHMI